MATHNSGSAYDKAGHHIIPQGDRRNRSPLVRPSDANPADFAPCFDTPPDSKKLPE
jgi:hypothetical protein